SAMCARVIGCFYFQAEARIRDLHVTGVQTCALPIYLLEQRPGRSPDVRQRATDAAVSQANEFAVAGRLGAGQFTDDADNVTRVQWLQIEPRAPRTNGSENAFGVVSDEQQQRSPRRFL